MRHTYTREELLSLRDTLDLESFTDPVPLDCPMRTDSDLLLHQTAVRKHDKTGGKQLRLLRGKTSLVNGAANEADTTPTMHASVLRAGFGEGMKAQAAANRTGYLQAWRGVLMPPRLQIPFVTIDAMSKHRSAGRGDEEGNTEVNLDAERTLVARLRKQQEQLQQKRQIIINQPLSSSTEQTSWSTETPASDGVVLATSPPHCVTAAAVTSQCAFMNETPPVVGIGSSPLPQLEFEAAVPISNVSLFNSVVGSRYFQFTRSIGVWHYFSRTLGSHYPQFFGHTPPVTKPGGDASNSPSSHSPNRVESSIGLDDTGTTPVEGEKSEGDGMMDDIRAAVNVKQKRPHRRRTNRTHAEKRANREALQLLIAQGNSCECGAA